MAEKEMDEEQLKALQEKLSKMSPEELKEFQKKQCIFCQIINGKVQSKKVYEDEHVIAILDINPANPGHILVMPKEHYSIMPQISDEEVGNIFVVAKALSNASLRALEAQGSNIIVANGVVAGQRAQHFMIHLIPRKENDNVNFNLPQKTIAEDELQAMHKKLTEALGTKAEKTEESKKEQIPKYMEKNVIDAEFREKPQKESILQLDKMRKEGKGAKDTEKEAKSSINLDDIAKILGAK
ncbi:HIT domain-containing protein [Candidatus Woesearchaeota archaeon]|nr:HIT domain-containing protein [Candidatus Woesearchaeota archaeon]